MYYPLLFPANYAAGPMDELREEAKTLGIKLQRNQNSVCEAFEDAVESGTFRRSFGMISFMKKEAEWVVQICKDATEEELAMATECAIRQRRKGLVPHLSQRSWNDKPEWRSMELCRPVDLQEDGEEMFVSVPETIAEWLTTSLSEGAGQTGLLNGAAS